MSFLDRFKDKTSQTLFCSYRSPKYEDLVNNRCVMLLNKKVQCQVGNDIYNICGNHNCLYKQFIQTVYDIIQNNIDIVKYYFHIPPRYLLPNNVLLTPREMMELTPMMFNDMIKSKFFVIFKLDERGDSFWTVLEREIWKNFQINHKKKPIVYLATKEGVKDRIELDGGISQPLSYICSKIRKKDDMWVGPVPPPLPTWSKLSDNIYIQTCPSCGNSFFLSIGFVISCANKKLEVRCPHCNKSYFTYSYFKDYFIYHHIGKSEYNNIVLSPNFVASLLVSEELPTSIPYYDKI